MAAESRDDVNPKIHHMPSGWIYFEDSVLQEHLHGTFRKNLIQLNHVNLSL
jgi:hypothetical protein